MFRYYCCRKWEEALNRPRFRCSCVVTGGIIVIMPWFRILIDVPPHFPGRATHPCGMPTEEEVEHQNNSDSRLLFSFFSWPLTHNNNHCHRCITILVSVCFHPLGTIMTSLNQGESPQEEDEALGPTNYTTAHVLSSSACSLNGHAAVHVFMSGWIKW